MVRPFRPVLGQSWFLPVLLVAISAVGSWKFACITPFVAFAAAAPYMLSTWTALLTVAAVWLVNQAIGFGVLGYPWTVDTMLWAIAIGTAALLAAGLAAAVLQLGIRNRITAAGAAFVPAFATYQAGLFLASFMLGGRDDFTPAIVGHVALLNLGWTVGLVGAYEILRYRGALIAARRRSSSAPLEPGLSTPGQRA
jgi:hypothetical protein